MIKNEVVLSASIDKEKVKTQIYEIRGHKVMIDKDIAEYFGVTTGNLNRAKNRNTERFPENFCFVLTNQELLLFQTGITKETKDTQGGRRNNLTVYTEQGVAMLTSVLHTERAISVRSKISTSRNNALFMDQF